jgi:hypothetical protein
MEGLFHSQLVHPPHQSTPIGTVGEAVLVMPGEDPVSLGIMAVSCGPASQGCRAAAAGIDLGSPMRSHLQQG